MKGVSCRLKYLQVTSRFSFTVPRSLISTASVCGSGQNRSSISHDTLPTTTWLARLFSSVTLMTNTEIKPHSHNMKEITSKGPKSHTFMSNTISTNLELLSPNVGELWTCLK